MSEVPLCAGSAWPRPFEEMVASLEDVEWGSMLTPFNPKVLPPFGNLNMFFDNISMDFGKLQRIFKKIFIYIQKILFFKKMFLKRCFKKMFFQDNFESFFNRVYFQRKFASLLLV